MSYTIFSFSRNCRKDTAMYAPSGDIAYWIETPRGRFIGNNSTFVYKASPYGGEGRELVARLEFHNLKKDLIDYGGQRCNLNDVFINKTEWLHKTRIVNTEAGQWKWSFKRGNPELSSTKPKRRYLARYHHNHSLLSASIPTLEVEYEALPYMDLVVIGWIVVMKDIEDESSTAAG